MDLQITFHGLDPSEALSDLVKERVERLRKVCQRMIHCRTAIEQPNHHHRHGNNVRVAVQVRMPGHEVVVNEQGEDAYTAVSTAFDVARRQVLAAQQH